MENELHTDETGNAFSQLLSSHTYSRFVENVLQVLARRGPFDRPLMEGIQKDHGVSQLTDYKDELLHVVLRYARLALDDHRLTGEECHTIRYLKRLFAIREGDFYQMRYHEVKEVLHKQFEHIYRDDDRISPEEAFHKVALQDVFDLSYDQFLEFKEDEIRQALARGADIRDLDTARVPK